MPRVPSPAPLLVAAFLLGSALLPPILPADEVPAASWHVWQVLDAKTGQAVDYGEWIHRLSAQEVLYVGEEHRNRSHIEAALKILDGLLANGRLPILGLEMFSWDGQAGLDRYLSDPAHPRSDFLRESRWEQNWGGAFEDYEPLISFARDRHLPVLALNPPRPAVRLVATKGLAQAQTAPEMSRWRMQAETFPNDPAYHEMIVTPLRQCHGGLSDQDYERMYEASVFRDERMAKTIVERLRLLTPPSGPIVSYTGGGHVQYHLPVPNRVLRRAGGPVKQISIYLTSFEPDRTDELRELMRNGVADYLWLTPLGAQGAPRRCT